MPNKNSFIVVFLVAFASAFVVCETASAQFIAFSTPQNGLLLNARNILATTDGGDTWKIIDTGMWLRDLAAINEKDYVASGDAIYHSSNFGKNWEPLRDTNTRNLNLAMLYQQVGYAYTNNGKAGGIVSYTSDGGLTWSIIAGPIGQDIRGLAFADHNNGLALSGEINQNTKQILRTRSGGTGWEAANFDAGIRDLRMESITCKGGIYLIVGVEQVRDLDDARLAVFMRSSDGGDAWSSKVSQTYSPLHSVDFGSDSLAIAVGENGEIARTTDAGISWHPIQSGTDNVLYSVRFKSPTEVFVKGHTPDYRSQILLRSKDGGLTWKEIQLPK